MNTAIVWLSGLVAYRSARLVLTAIGVALAVALLLALGVFISASAATMTQRSIQSVPVDWQLQLAPGADAAAVRQAISDAAAVQGGVRVEYADVRGFSASTGGSNQTSGSGKVIGIPASYVKSFPAEFRILLGSLDGVMIAQQTAANLHVTVGDTVTIQRVELSPVDVKIAAVVDLPYADSFFQAVGIPSNAAPQAPPDNVLFVPVGQWHALFDAQALNRPESVRAQFHIRLMRNLPADPQAAFMFVQQSARNFEARIAGSGVIADNLAAQLDAVRADASYARILFLFLGLPGALLAIILTLAVANAGGEHRRLEQSLLRVRGARSSQVLQLAALEGFFFGVLGVILGVLLGEIAVRTMLPIGAAAAQVHVRWISAAAVFGLVAAICATLIPAWRELRGERVLAARHVIGGSSTPLWQQMYLDFALLALAALMFWRTAGIGYELVLAPEGVAQVSIAYESFVAPLSLWLGGALLAMRLSTWALAGGRRWFAMALRPIANNLSRVIVLSLSRQRSRLAAGIALVALAVAFAVSTAVFNTTYDAQARIDAELTNGADVSVRGTSRYPAGSELDALRKLAGVSAAQPMQHRFAYVGNDLQDLYGIDPSRMGGVTQLADSYFANHDAAAVLRALAAQPDGILVSEETKNDFLLAPGDHLKLRMVFAADHQYHLVSFTFLGVAREFPTAPKDSFLVANASYVAKQTGFDSAEYVLIKTSGDSRAVAEAAAQISKGMPAIQVTEIGNVQKQIGSNLTAIDLRGLTLLELSFAVLLAAGASGLMLALGFAERKRTFATLLVLGARKNQLGAFVWSEAVTILLGGAVLGSIIGLALAECLVLMLTHVFDPPPEGLLIPWAYLAVLTVILALATALPALVAIRAARQAGVSVLRAG